MVVFVVVFMVVWISVGLAVGVREVRRGHWRWLWLLGAIVGPFAIPLARQLELNELMSHPIPVRSASPERSPGLRLLVGIDGSEESSAAARTAVDLLGFRLGGVTLAAVADHDVNEALPGPVGPDHDAVLAERHALDEASGSLEGWLGFGPSTVILTGTPAHALMDHATAEQFDLIAVGRRGAGVSKWILGSCASELARRSTVPALIVPPETPAGAERHQRHTESRKA